MITLGPADAIVGGTALIDGRPVVVAAEDFTVQGGSIGFGAHAKRIRYAQLALQEKMPFVIMLEGAGERTTNGMQRHPYAPNDLQVMAELRGKVPTVALVMGASAGHGALSGLLMDFIVMVEGSALFSAAPVLALWRMPRVLVVWGSSAPGVGPFRDEWRRSLERRLARTFDRYVALASVVERNLRDYGFAAERIRLIPNGAATDRFRPREEADRAGRPGSAAPLFVSVGRLVPAKGLADLLDGDEEASLAHFENAGGMTQGLPEGDQAIIHAGAERLSASGKIPAELLDETKGEDIALLYLPYGLKNWLHDDFENAQRFLKAYREAKFGSNEKWMGEYKILI